MTKLEMLEFDRENAELNNLRSGMFRDLTITPRQPAPQITSLETRLQETGMAGILFGIINVLTQIMHESGDLSARLTVTVFVLTLLALAGRLVWVWRKA